MAENKKSFILYADQAGLFDKLPDVKAGKLIKIIFDYINDKNPNPKDILLQVAFEPIKLQLKRDLREWEAERSKRSEAGKKGGIKSGESRRAGSKRSSASKNEANEADNVTVTVNVNDTLREIEIGATIEFCVYSIQRQYDSESIIRLWKAFLINGQKENYAGREKKIQHFRNWIKTQPHENGKTHQRTNGSGVKTKLGTSEARIAGLKKWGLGGGAE